MFGMVSAVRFAGTLDAGLESVADGGGTGAAAWLEHAVQTPRSTAVAERLLIGGLLI
jgi:hypothetical protein